MKSNSRSVRNGMEKLSTAPNTSALLDEKLYVVVENRRFLLKIDLFVKILAQILPLYDCSGLLFPQILKAFQNCVLSQFFGLF